MYISASWTHYQFFTATVVLNLVYRASLARLEENGVRACQEKGLPQVTAEAKLITDEARLTYKLPCGTTATTNRYRHNVRRWQDLICYADGNRVCDVEFRSM